MIALRLSQEAWMLVIPGRVARNSAGILRGCGMVALSAGIGGIRLGHED
jgi:hypothetical protein